MYSKGKFVLACLHGDHREQEFMFFTVDMFDNNDNNVASFSLVSSQSLFYLLYTSPPVHSLQRHMVLITTD